jgi:hypothetical protein
MENRVNRIETDFRTIWPRAEENRGPQAIGAVLAELLAQYQARFPEVRIVVVETPVAAV